MKNKNRFSSQNYSFEQIRQMLMEEKELHKFVVLAFESSIFLTIIKKKKKAANVTNESLPTGKY